MNRPPVQRYGVPSPWRAVRLCGLHTLPHGHFRAGHSLPLHQVVVPVFMHREQDAAVVSCSLQFFLETPGRRLPGLVVVQAEHHIMEAGVLLQHPVHDLAAGAAQGHIAVPLPAVRVQRQKGQHVHGRLEHIEQAVLSHVVEAVLGPAALHVDLEGFALAVGAPLMGVAGDALLIHAHKDAVVVLGVLIYQSGPGEVGDHLPADVALLHQVGVHPAHIGVGRRKGEGIGRLLLLWLRGGICRTQLLSQQELHGLLIGCPVVVLNEADRVAAPPGNMVVPFAAPDGDMVHPGQPGLPPGAEQLLALPPQEFLQINRVRPLLLLVGKVDIGSHVDFTSDQTVDFGLYFVYTLSRGGAVHVRDNPKVGQQPGAADPQGAPGCGWPEGARPGGAGADG